MSHLIERSLRRLGDQLPGRLSLPGEPGYAAATAIWAKQVDRRPRAVVHCRAAGDVQAAIRAAREDELPLSVRGGGHDWAGRALCDGIVIDLRGMNRVLVAADGLSAHIGGGARFSDILATTDRLGLAAVVGSVSTVGMAGFTLGGGYGALIGRFGLALDNLLAAEVVLSDGRVVIASQDSEAELFWALRGGGGNFGVVTSMRHRLHELPGVRSGMLIYPSSEAKIVLQGCAELTQSMPDEFTVQLGFAVGLDGRPVVLVVPTWSGPPALGEARMAPLLGLGTLLAGSLEAMSYRASLAMFDAHIAHGQRTFMESCWIPALDGRGIDLIIHAMETSVLPGSMVFTHDFKGAASRIEPEATSFGLRRDHVLIEILATYPGRPDALSERGHSAWVRATLESFDSVALPGGYPNMLPDGDRGRAAKSYGPNLDRLGRAKRTYDPDNLFRSAIPLPVGQESATL
jgi:FAD/FMN-containing dehydrogenase